jgi:hypothetical protein
MPTNVTRLIYESSWKAIMAQLYEAESRAELIIDGTEKGCKDMAYETALVYQMKVTLTGIEPPIWRRFRITMIEPSTNFT